VTRALVNGTADWTSVHCIKRNDNPLIYERVALPAAIKHVRNRSSFSDVNRRRRGRCKG